VKKANTLFVFDETLKEKTDSMSKTDLKTRPIFHYTHDAIKAGEKLLYKQT